MKLPTGNGKLLNEMMTSDTSLIIRNWHVRPLTGSAGKVTRLNIENDKLCQQQGKVYVCKYK